MNIGILTFHKAINFGAVFQAYALQTVLNQLGHNTYIIDYAPQYLLADYKILNFKKKNIHSLKDFIKLSAHELLSISTKWKRQRYFRKFQNRLYNLIPFDSRLSELNAIIFGSDQIWNTDITQGIDSVFWGDNPLFKDKRLISYAASSGYASILKPWIPEIEKILKDFYALGVREQDLYEFIAAFNNNVRLTVDPVILAGPDVFSKIAVRNTKTKPFLLLFQLGHDPSARKIAEEIAESKGLEILEVLSLTVSLKGKNIINSISPERLIGLFEQCDYVVTSSFHGTVFSLLYNKEFIYLQYNEHGAQRVKQLLSALNISKHHLSHPESVIPQEPIDYNAVNLLLKQMRHESIKFLKDALS